MFNMECRLFIPGCFPLPWRLFPSSSLCYPLPALSSYGQLACQIASLLCTLECDIHKLVLLDISAAFHIIVHSLCFEIPFSLDFRVILSELFSASLVFLYFFLGTPLPLSLCMLDFLQVQA